MKVFAACPFYGTQEAESSYSFARLWGQLGPTLEAFDFAYHTRDCHQPQARNLLLRLFLDTGFDRLVMVDKDMVFTPEDVSRLLLADVDLVGTCARCKDGSEGIIGDPLVPASEKGPLLEMRRIGFGLVVMSRACAQKMSDAYEAAGFVPKGGSRVVSDVFVRGKDPETREPIGVDSMFCDRWREMGGQVWLHRGVKVGHIGTRIY